MTSKDWLTSLNPLANPLVVRGLRTRLRPSVAAGAGLVTLTLAIFVYIMVYSTVIQRIPLAADASPQEKAQIVKESARAAIPALIILQGLILMVLGTGAAAGGIARERTDRLLDYHRLTPMPPHAKIIGLLFGLPIREYFMFALTVPFVMYAMVKGEVPVWPMLQFYMVFFCSVWLYHLTGMVSGMVVDRPWRAGFFVQALIIGLYVVLPQLSGFGLTFFQHLTARPAFYGIVQGHLLPPIAVENIGDLQQTAGDRLRILQHAKTSFFNFNLPPVIFSLFIQGSVLVLLLSIIARKWRRQANLAVSKPMAIAAFIGVQFLILGTLSPMLRNDDLFALLVKDPTAVGAGFMGSGRWVIWRLAFVTLGVSGVAGTVLLYLLTPKRYQQINMLRRARQRGRSGVPWLSDAASPLPVAGIVIGVSLLCFFLLLRAAEDAGRVPGGLNWTAAMLLMVFLAMALLSVQLLCEQIGEKLFTFIVFVAWVIPFLAWAILFFPLHQQALATFIALPCPVTPIYLGCVLLVHDPALDLGNTIMLPDEVAAYATEMLVVAVVGYAVVTLGLLMSWARHRRRLLALAGWVSEPVESHPPIPQPQAAG